jgi:YD repeat-containing protein
MNQYTATPCDKRTYDDNGNLTNRSLATGPVTYQYDYADRLVQVLDYSTGTLSPVASYTYDALGRRVSKTVYSGGKPTTRQYCYDGTCAIEERENSAVTASYVLDDRYLLGLRLGTQDYFVHTDDQGNALALTGAGGAVIERYDYDDYGAVTFLGANGAPLVGSDGLPVTSSPAGNVYCWGGLRLDAETGLQNDDGGSYLETTSGRYVLRAGVPLRFDASAATYPGNNPWSGGSPDAMQKGTVKWFNDAKGFGMVVGGGGGGGGGGGSGGSAFKTKPKPATEGKKEFVGHVSLLK